MVVEVPSLSAGLDSVSIQGEFGSYTFTEPLRILQASSVNFDRQVVFGESLFYRSLEIADINNDGYDDLITGDTGGKIVIHYNNQDKTYTSQSVSFTAGMPVAEQIKLADLDKNGDLDLVYITGLSVSYRLNNAGTFGSPNTVPGYTLPAGSNFESLELFDFDGDGYLDVLVSDLGLIRWNKYNPTNSTTPFESTEFFDTFEDPGFSLNAPIIQTADLDNDGKIDIVGSISLFGTSQSILFWYRNLGDGEFSDRLDLLTSSGNNVYDDFYITDIDGDQRFDIVYTITATNNSGQTYWHQNLGSGTFGIQLALSGSLERATNFVDIDLNGDGFMILFLLMMQAIMLIILRMMAVIHFQEI